MMRVLSAQVIAETASVLRRKLKMERPAIETVLSVILARVQCEPITAATVLSALRIGERFGYSHYDSQIIASALAAGCSILYSEDMQHGQTSDGTLSVINPFAA